MTWVCKPFFVLTIVLILANGVIQGQENQSFKCRVIDTKHGLPIPFATILLLSEKGTYGVVSNADGDFLIPFIYKDIVDTLKISCIGYVTKKIPFANLVELGLNVVKLKEAIIQLAEVVVTPRKAKSISARKIVKLAIQSIPLNYTNFESAYSAYYRDYQLWENKYTNLNEAIVEVFDKGFKTNDQLDTKIYLTNYKKNTTFPRDSMTEIAYDNKNRTKFIPSAILFPFGGNELTILRIHDAIRNYDTLSYSFVNVFARDFINNHFFKLKDTVFLNDIPLYKISFQSQKQISGRNHFAIGSIYIEKGNYAIHKFEYSTFEKDIGKQKMLYNIQVEYTRVDSLMRLNYISFNNLFNIRDPKDFVVEDIALDRNISAFVIQFNNRIDRQSAKVRANYDLRLSNKKLLIERIEFINDNYGVNLYLKDTSAFKMKSTKLSPSISAVLRNIKDENGREVNEPTYISINQFREMFVQRHTSIIKNVADSLVIDKTVPLSRGLKNNGLYNDGSNYWMNTPLKKE